MLFVWTYSLKGMSHNEFMCLLKLKRVFKLFFQIFYILPRVQGSFNLSLETFMKVNSLSYFNSTAKLSNYNHFTSSE